MVAKELFADYVKEKKLRELEKKREFAQPLKTSETEEGPWGVWKTSDLAWTHFKWTRGINIINDGEFNEANKVFAARYVQLKKDGRAKAQHKTSILDRWWPEKNCTKAEFSIHHPKTLLNKVFFVIMLCFCRCGRQNLRQLKKADFEVHTDAMGAQFVSKVLDDVGAEPEGGVMYATRGVWCPVPSFEKYL